MMNYESLRKQYTDFYYHSWNVKEEEDSIRISWNFEIKGLSEFEPVFIVPKPEGTQDYLTSRLFREAVFSLGMVELISYWKITGCPRVHVECGALDETQIAWWKKLYFHGLGEYFYINHIPLDPEGFMELISEGRSQEGTGYFPELSGNLIPVGGGKDSFVSLDLLSPYKKDNCAFIINPVISAVNSAHAAGYEDGKDLLIAKRILDQRMLELNKQGYLNGHTPFSAMVAFATYLTAFMYGRKYITLSNESSANESTIKGSTVNHQYSKTFEFEEDFHMYCKNYLNPEIQYFSLLRPISELQITGLFSRMKSYHSVFRSCNVGSKKGIWCGHCAKCLFVCVMLSAYLPQNEIRDIFGVDMLNDETMMELFEQLTGLVDDKPFECVGTRDEVNVAICMAIRTMQETDKEIPLLYQKYMSSSYYNAYKDRKVDMTAWNSENGLPENYQVILKKKLEECAHEL